VSELFAAGVPGQAAADEMRAELHVRGHETVERVLHENRSRWQSLSAADRLTVEALLEAVASRLIDGCAPRIEPAHVELLRELFALGGDAGGEAPG
jgi:hypothetical protein